MRHSFWKLFRTSTFRLSALYLFVFVLSVGAILAYIYWNTAGLLERQTDETIRAEVQGLADQYRIRGLTGVLDTVRRRSSDDSGSIYLLTTPDGVRAAGNLVSVPDEIAIEESGWTEFAFNVKTSTGTEPHQARVYYTELPGGNILVVGRDIEDMRQFASIIRNTLITGTLIALALGIGGGLLTSRNFLRRVDSITDASRSIMQSTWVVSRPPSPRRYRKRTVRSLPAASIMSGLEGDGPTVQSSGVRNVNDPEGCVCSSGNGGGGGRGFLPAQAGPAHTETARIAATAALCNLLELR